MTGTGTARRPPSPCALLSLVWPIVCLSLLSVLTSCTHARPWMAGNEAACHAHLEAAGVGFETVPQASAVGVVWPIKLTGSVLGIRIYGGNKNAPTNYLDCRLALALVEWAPLLKREGVVGLQHYSMYRKDAVVGRSTRLSSHALGRAIDVAFFDMRDGRRLSVLADWKNRVQGVDPCGVSSGSEAEKVMRDLVCEARDREVFEMVLTPHYNEAHKNHVHLDIGSHDPSWTG
jgi:hypothetical protein